MKTTSTLAVTTAALLLSACGAGGNGRAIHASGHIEATEVRLAAKLGGRLVELPHREGDAVRAGDVVARFDTVDSELELARGEAELQRADAQLRREAGEVLRALDGVVDVQAFAARHHVRLATGGGAERRVRAGLEAAGLTVLEVRQISPSLEDTFLHLTRTGTAKTKEAA